VKNKKEIVWLHKKNDVSKYCLWRLNLHYLKFQGEYYFLFVLDFQDESDKYLAILKKLFYNIKIKLKSINENQGEKQEGIWCSS
jgi:hypothetical protein